MRSLLLCCFLAAGAANGAAVFAQEGELSPQFKTAYQAAVERAGKAFEHAKTVEPEKAAAALKDKATTEADKAKLERLAANLKQMDALREPVAAPANQPDPKGEILEKQYLAKVEKLAKEFKADSAITLEVRRALLRAKTGQGGTAAAAGKDGKPGEPAVGPAPSEAMQAKLDAQAGRKMDLSRARSIAGALDMDRNAGVLNAGGVAPMGAAVRADATRVAARAPAEPLHASDFAVGGHLKTGAVPAGEHREAPPAEGETGWWAKTKAALTTPAEGMKEAYKGFAERRMADSERLEQEGAKKLEQGGVMNTLSAGWDATKAWGNRVVAGDPKAVGQAAIGAAVAVGAVVAAPVVAAGSVAAGIGIAVEAGVAGLTTYNVVKGTAAVAKEPNVANAGLLALNFAPVPYLGKIAHAAGTVAEKGVVALKSASVDSKLAAGAFSGMVAIAEKIGAKEVQAMTKAAVHDMTEVAGHQASHAMVHTAAATIEEHPTVH